MAIDTQVSYADFEKGRLVSLGCRRRIESRSSSTSRFFFWLPYSSTSRVISLLAASSSALGSSESVWLNAAVSAPARRSSASAVRSPGAGSAGGLPCSPASQVMGVGVLPTWTLDRRVRPPEWKTPLFEPGAETDAVQRRSPTIFGQLLAPNIQSLRQAYPVLGMLVVSGST